MTTSSSHPEMSGTLLGYAWRVEVPDGCTRIDDTYLVFGCERRRIYDWKQPSICKMLAERYVPGARQQEYQAATLHLAYFISGALVLPEKPKRQPTFRGKELRRIYRKARAEADKITGAAWTEIDDGSVWASSAEMAFEDLEREIMAAKPGSGIPIDAAELERLYSEEGVNESRYIYTLNRDPEVVAARTRIFQRCLQRLGQSTVELDEKSVQDSFWTNRAGTNDSLIAVCREVLAGKHRKS